MVGRGSVKSYRTSMGSPAPTWRSSAGRAGCRLVRHEARRIADDASITPVLVDGDGKVLHVGRRSRAVPASVRRALNLRDQHCQAPGCTMPAELCSPHHEPHWADGGDHTLHQLRLYCNFHHAKRHPENARFRHDDGGSAAIPTRAP